jgi:hypothetical protein
MIVGLSGCLEISETIKINKDKSGSISYELKSSNTANFLNKFSGLFNISIEEQVVNEAEKFILQLRKQEGISNIQQNFDTRRGSYAVSFDFKNSKYFNEALYHMAGSKKNIFTPGYIKVKDSRFKKINFSPWLKRYLEKENISISSFPLTELITFTSVVELPYKIVKVKPKDVIIAKNQKEAKQKFKLIEITSGKARTGIRIKYEN